MTKHNFPTRKPLAAAIFALLALPGFALAQTSAADPKEDKKSAVDLERIVVTATPTGVSTMRSSVSVSTTTVEQIQASQAQSAAEALRSIPGIRSESSGGEGNANITVRGVPISAGGARYVQLQENGLPVMLFGDVAFATSDMFLRVDGMLDSVQAVRGGSASTLATNSPGGVVNFITKYGAERGGNIGLSFGLDYDQQRVDFDYGSGVGQDGSSFAIGGHYRQGKGVRDSGVKIEQGGQLQAAYNMAFGAGNYVRVTLKAIEDQAPTNLPVPVSITNGKISEIVGLDPRYSSPYGNNWPTDPVLRRDNTIGNTDVNSGLSVSALNLGIEGGFNLGNGLKVENRFRFSDLSGRFIGVFPFDVLKSATYTIASGPNKGTAWTGIAAKVATFNTELNDLGSVTNDLRFIKSFGLGGTDKLDVTGGLFYNTQNVSTTWHFNHYQLQVVNSNPALLANGDTNANGRISFGAKDWGYCCQRIYDLTYKTLSPYVNVGYQAGPLNLDAGVRIDRQSASGVYFQGDASGATTANPTNIRYSATPTQKIDYDKNHTSFTLGGNYRLNRDMSVFARYSDGVAFKADRIVNGDSALDGSAPIKIDTVQQAEIGVKLRTGNLSTFVTLFSAKTKEAGGFEATTQKIIQNDYEAKGLEVEAAYNMGDFRLAGGFTFTDSEITGSSDKSVVGNTPRRQAKLIYTLTPSYTVGPVSIGASIIGTGKSFSQDDNKVTMDGFAVINAFVNYQVMSNFVVGLGVNNLANVIGYTESEGSVARSINGRSIKASLKYSF